MRKLVRQEQTAERGMVRQPDRWTDRQLTEGWIDSQTDGQRDRQTADRGMDRQTDSTLLTLPSPSSR